MPASPASPPASPLPPGLVARLWLTAAELGLEDAPRLWLHRTDGRVLAFCVPAVHAGDDTVIPALLAATDDDLRGTRLGVDLPGGLATALYGAPAAPMPHCAWGHPTHAAARAFAQTLDQALLRLLADLDTHRLWSSARNYSRLAALPPELRLRRTQAVARFPVLAARVLLTAHKLYDYAGGKRHAWRDHDDNVLEAIDHGRDLVGALAEKFDLPRSLVRAPVCATMWGDTGLSHTQLLALLAGMPAHARPTSPQALAACAPLLLWLRRLGPDDATLARIGGTALRVGLESALTGLGATPQELDDTRDFLAAARAELNLQAMRPTAGLALAWLATLGLASLIRASRRWHAQPAVAVWPEECAGWPTVLGRHEAGGFLAEELAAPSALAAEGEAMHHCIADYALDCLGEATRVFRVTAPDGARSTAEYVVSELDAADPYYALNELRGPYNAEPGKAEWRFAIEMAGALNATERAAARHHAFRAAREASPRLHELRPGLSRPLDARSHRAFVDVLEAEHHYQRNMQSRRLAGIAAWMTQRHAA